MDRRVFISAAAALLVDGGVARAEIVKVVPIPMADQDNWTPRSRQANDLAPRLAFLLQSKIYVGDPRDAAGLSDPQQHRRVELPRFPRHDPLRPTVDEAAAHEAELAAYYRRVMDLTSPHPLRREENYWLRLGFVSETLGVEIRFPWWDRLADMAKLVRWLHDAPDGADFFDADQGWMFRAVRRGQRLHFHDSDLESQEEYANLSVARAPFLERLDISFAEARGVIAKLKQQLGVDPWS